MAGPYVTPGTIFMWLDLETTGLEQTDVILEGAFVFTTPDGLPIGPDVCSFLMDPLYLTELKNERVRAMHTKNGLIEAIERSGRYTHAEAEAWMLDRLHEAESVIRSTGIANLETTVHLAGNSIAFDRGFIRRTMPKLHAALHRRMVDVTALRIAAEAAGLAFDEGEPSHRAVADVHHSMDVYLQIINCIAEGKASFDRLRGQNAR